MPPGQADRPALSDKWVMVRKKEALNLVTNRGKHKRNIGACSHRLAGININGVLVCEICGEVLN